MVSIDHRTEAIHTGRDYNMFLLFVFYVQIQNYYMMKKLLIHRIS